MNLNDTLVVSDIHLGSSITRLKELHQVLDRRDYKRLILLGDIFEELNFLKYSPEQLDFVSYLRKLSDVKEVIWIEGNHDEGMMDFFPKLIGIEILNEYEWKYKGEKYLALHGHQFDNILKNKQITKFAYNFHKFIQKVDLTKTNSLSRFIQRKSTQICNISEKIASDAMAYANGKRENIRYVICGHTHVATSFEEQDIVYYNSGCWTQNPASYLTISDHGIKINTLH